MHGIGTYTFSNGDVYTGEYRNGHRTGHGTYKYANGNTYEGDVLDGVINGNGIFTWPNGDRYDGEWVAGLFEGHGTYTTTVGNNYRGEWHHGLRHGHGVLYDGATNHRAEGTFINGNIDGYTEYDAQGHEVRVVMGKGGLEEREDNSEWDGEGEPTEEDIEAAEEAGEEELEGIEDGDSDPFVEEPDTLAVEPTSAVEPDSLNAAWTPVFP